jgi:hypothetical protein
LDVSATRASCEAGSFVDGARVLLARGHDPETPYYMRHARSQVQAFVATTLGHAAGLRAVDDGSGMRFRKFIPFEGPIADVAE